MRAEAFGVRRSRLCGDVFGILEGSRPRQLTVEIAPSFGFGALIVGYVRASAFRVGIAQMIPKDAAVTYVATGGWTIGFIST